MRVGSRRAWHARLGVHVRVDSQMGVASHGDLQIISTICSLDDLASGKSRKSSTDGPFFVYRMRVTQCTMWFVLRGWSEVLWFVARGSLSQTLGHKVIEKRERGVHLIGRDMRERGEG